MLRLVTASWFSHCQHRSLDRWPELCGRKLSHDRFHLAEEQAKSGKTGAGYNFPAPLCAVPVVVTMP